MERRNSFERRDHDNLQLRQRHHSSDRNQSYNESRVDVVHKFENGPSGSVDDLTVTFTNNPGTSAHGSTGFGKHQGSSSFGNHGSTSFGNHGSTAAHGSTGYGSTSAHGSTGFGRNHGSTSAHGSTGFGNHGSTSFANHGSTSAKYDSHSSSAYHGSSTYANYGSTSAHGSSGYANHGSTGFGNHGSTSFGNNHGSTAAHGSTGYGSTSAHGSTEYTGKLPLTPTIIPTGNHGSTGYSNGGYGSTGFSGGRNNEEDYSLAIDITLPERVDPSKVCVTVKDDDVIVKIEDQKQGRDGTSSFSFFQKHTIPRGADVNGIRCVLNGNKLSVKAPFAGQGQNNGRRVQNGQPLPIENGYGGSSRNF